MLLDDLLSVIETLQQRIRDHEPTLRENETRTRMALIDPVLVALGWEVSDPAAVTPEYAVGNGRADYALLDEKGTAIAFIEAKHLGEPLERPQHEEQVFTYALRQQVKYAALTDGDRWILDDVSVFSGERRILDMSIAHTPAHQCALQLLLLWHPNLASGKAIPASEPILPVAPLASPSASQDILTAPPPPAAPIVEDGWEAMSSLKPEAGDSNPTAVRFPGSPDHLVTSWRQLVHVTVDWLCQRGLLTETGVPVASSAKRFIVNSVPIHPTGKPFSSSKFVAGTPFVYEGNISSRAAVSNTKKLLTHCGINPADVLLRLE